MEHSFAFFENHEVKALFSESPQFDENFAVCVGINLAGKVSPKCMSANADSVVFKLACNVNVLVYFENYEFLANIIFNNKKMAYGFWQHISCIKFLVVCDFEALFKRCKRSGHSGSLRIAFKWGD